MTGSKTSDAGNLFLAIIPDADVAARIYERAEKIRRARGFRAPVIARDRLHVTLLSLNRFTDSEVSATCQAIGEMRSAPFEVSFDRTMSFRGKPGILPFVLAGDDGLKTLRSFRRSFTVELTRKGLGDRGRREFTPHVTLFFLNRAVEEHPFWPIRWIVRDIVLIHSMNGHRHLARWPLHV